jgi:hypothetical protein
MEAVYALGRRLTTSEVSQQLLEEFHGQADDVGKAAFDVVDEFVAGFLDAVGAGPALPGAAGNVLGDLLFAHGAGVDDRDSGADDLGVVTQADQRQTGDDVVRAAEELSGDGLGLGGVGGLADDFALEVDQRVGADDDAIGISRRDILRLGQREGVEAPLTTAASSTSEGATSNV